MTVRDDLRKIASEKASQKAPQKAPKSASPEKAEKKTDPLSKHALASQSFAKRSTRRNRRRGFTPERRGRPKRTISGGSR